MTRLLSDVSEGKCLDVVERFYLLLPTIDAHNGHLATPLGVAAARLSQRVHPDIAEKINDFVSVGVRDAGEVKKLQKLEVSITGGRSSLTFLLIGLNLSNLHIIPYMDVTFA